MAKKAKAKTRRAGTSAGGRPSLHGPKTERPGILLTLEQRHKAEADAEIIGCSISDAVGSAIDVFDAAAYKRARVDT